MVPEPLTSGNGAARLTSRRVGPGLPPIAGVRTLAADSHFAGALVTVWARAEAAGEVIGFPPAERAEIAAAVTEGVHEARVGRRHLLAVTVESELVGAASLAPRRTASQRCLAELDWLVVDPDLPLLTPAEVLLGDVVGLAAELGIHTLLARVTQGRAGEGHLRRAGFTEYGRVPRASSVEDRELDDILYLRAVVAG